MGIEVWITKKFAYSDPNALLPLKLYSKKVMLKIKAWAQRMQHYIEHIIEYRLELLAGQSTESTTIQIVQLKYNLLNNSTTEYGGGAHQSTSLRFVLLTNAIRAFEWGFVS
jgi:hypothetical protein